MKPKFKSRQIKDQISKDGEDPYKIQRPLDNDEKRGVACLMIVVILIVGAIAIVLLRYALDRAFGNAFREEVPCSCEIKD